MAKNTLRQELETHTRNFEEPLRQVEGQLAAVAQDDLQLQASVNEIYTELAKLNLINMVNLTHDARVHLDLRMQEEAAARKSLAKVEAEIADANATLQTAETTLAKSHEQLRILLSSDPVYVQDSQALDRVEADVKASTDLAAEIDAECDGKLPAFESDPGFGYLLRAGYGTEEYRRGGFFKRADRWIAGLIDFERNRANYESLKSMRSTLASRRLALGNSVEEIRKKVQDRVAAAQSNTDLEPSRRAVSVAQATVERFKSEAKRLQGVLQEYVDRTDFRYVRAYKSIADAMTEVPLEQLEAAARETPDTRDDELVAELAKKRLLLSGNAEKTSRLSKIRTERNVQYQRAKTIERSLRSDRYTGSDYRYESDFNLTSFLAGYMVGDMTSKQVENQLLGLRQEVPAPIPYNSGGGDYRGSVFSSGGSSGGSSGYSSSGSSGFSFGGSSGGSSSSSDSYSSSDSFGGGSSSTSDSF
ncbi:hypothetical protein [Herbaspirillum sp. RV1423]|uniref:hypothetical protein n=1 Tax=Herbaspirillum sp. RV1423 TaxID=1443993 RepID=UPI0004B62527|nr:hypothetical protein [Herbaspirillum sp. RV1423]